MPSVSRVFLLLVLALHACFHIVDSVQCAKDSDCIQTDFTLPKCQNGVCSCKAPYKPISTGCGKKFEKPTISFNSTPSSMVWAYEGTQDAELTCQGQSTRYPKFDAALKRVWKFGDKLLNETSQSLKINISPDTVASPYTCAVTSPNSGDESLNSDFSEPFQITMVKDKELPGGNWKPELIVPKKSLANAELPMKCSNLPIGSMDGGLKAEIYSTTSSSPMQDHTFTKDIELFCKATLESDSTKSKDSDKVEVKVADNIEGVIISIEGRPPSVTSHTAKTGQTDKITLMCEDDGNVAVKSSDLKYSWKAGSETFTGSGDNGFQLVVDTTVAGQKTYTCAGKVGSQSPVESTGITITVEDEPLPKHDIEVTPNPPLLGGVVSFACGEKDPSGKEEYWWTGPDGVIFGQHDRVIQFHNLGPAGFYKTPSCLVVKDLYREFRRPASDNILVIPNKPTLTETKRLNKGHTTYTLNCATLPSIDGMVYKFYKNGEDIYLKDYPSIMILKNARPSDSGNYTCTASLNAKPSDVSNAVTVFVPGSATLLKVSIFTLALAVLLSLRIL